MTAKLLPCCSASVTTKGVDAADALEGGFFDSRSTTHDWDGGTGATGFWEPHRAEGGQEQMPQ